MVPTSCNPVVIRAGDTVTVDLSSATASTMTVNGTLSFSRTVSSTMTIVGGNVTVSAGGWLDMGSPSVPISQSSATLILAYGATQGQFGLTINPGGNFTVKGSTKTPYTTATGDALQSATINVDMSSVVNWSTGDVITVSFARGVNSLVNETETRVIAGISGNTLSLGSYAGSNASLDYNHYSSWTIQVANLSRNVVVRSSGTAVNANTAYIHNLATSATSFSLMYGEFAYLGADTGGRDGIYFDAASAKGFISSSTIRNGYVGVSLLNGSNGNTFSRNVLYANNYGFYLINSSGNVITQNHVIATLFTAISADAPAPFNTISYNALLS